MKFSKKDFMRLKEQDVLMFNLLVNANANNLYNFLLIKTKGNTSVAEDLLQETFLAAFQSAPALASSKNIKSWLLKIAHRKFIDFQRKIFREKKYAQLLQEQPNPEEDTVEKLHRKEQALLLNMALEKINSSYKEILYMKYRDGKSIKEIAENLKKTERSIISILFRAKESVKKEIGKISKDFIRGQN